MSVGVTTCLIVPPPTSSLMRTKSIIEALNVDAEDWLLDEGGQERMFFLLKRKANEDSTVFISFSFAVYSCLTESYTKFI